MIVVYIIHIHIYNISYSFLYFCPDISAQHLLTLGMILVPTHSRKQSFSKQLVHMYAPEPSLLIYTYPAIQHRNLFLVAVAVYAGYDFAVTQLMHIYFPLSYLLARGCVTNQSYNDGRIELGVRT